MRLKQFLLIKSVLIMIFISIFISLDSDKAYPQSCFLAGTKVTMADGTTKSIEDVRSGDMVVSFDENFNKIISEVSDLDITIRDHYYIVYLENGAKLNVTRDHPMWMKSENFEGWGTIDADFVHEEYGFEEGFEFGQIKVNDYLLHESNEWVKIKKLKFVKVKSIKAYNLIDVGNVKTFFAEGFMAHNYDQPPPAGSCDLEGHPVCGSYGCETGETCSSCPADCGVSNRGQSCGSCGGTVQDCGSCSVSTPGNYGASCGSCGGTINCAGSCSVSTPGNYGASCGSCGGTINCAGSCSVSTPGNYGASCGSCGGTVNCAGSCSVSTPGNYGASCGSCGGTINCAGSCSVSTPSNYGQPCIVGIGACQRTGTLTCSGSCSVTPGTPSAEICDNLDNDCNGVTDENCDDDNDNFCDSSIAIIGTPTTCTSGGNDCNDINSAINPSAIEICDDIDNNCNGNIDEGCDDDNDNFCDSSMIIIGTPSTCPLGGGDCNDANANIKPGEVELCADGVDNNCNSQIDLDDIECFGNSGGIVTDESGNRLQGATINIFLGSQKIATGLTDQNGKYDIMTKAGNATTIASLTNYVPKAFSFEVFSNQYTWINFSNQGGDSLSNAGPLISDFVCESDCTYAGDDQIHGDCNNQNNCTFYDDHTSAVCNLAQNGWIRQYNSTHNIKCPSSTPVQVNKTEAIVVCSKENLVKTTKVIKYQGKLAKFIIVTCGT